jgi:tyrosinase
MIELCWYDWNLLRGNSNTNSPDWTQRTFTEFVDRSGAAVSISVASMLLFPLLSYQYDGPVHSDCTSACAPVARNAARAPRTARQLEREEDGQEVRRELREGAQVRFGLANATRVGGLTALNLNKAQTIEMPQLSRLKALPRSQRALLRLNGVEDKLAGDVFVRVFINKPDATPDTPLGDPHDAGSLAFFGHGHHPRIFNLEITDAIRRASADGSDPTVQLIVVPFSGQQTPSPTVAVDSVEVGAIEESVVPSPQ